MVRGELHGGTPETPITDIAEINNATDTEITFVGNSRYYKHLDTTKAAAVILPSNYSGDFTPRIVVQNPQMAVKILIDHFQPPLPQSFEGIHESAVIHQTAKIGKNVTIGPGAVIGLDSIIGDNTIVASNVNIGQECSVGHDTHIYPGVTLYDRTTVGARVIIHSGTVIGSDGYGFTQEDGIHKKIRQVGSVRIGDDVEIGSNCSIDRATLGETVIGEGSKLDNLIQIGHNVKIGKGCLIVAQVGIAGSTQLGDYVIVGGQTGFAGHLKIGDQVTIASKAGVTKDIASGQTVSGFPAIPHNDDRKQIVYIRQLPEMAQRLKALEDKVTQGESPE